MRRYVALIVASGLVLCGCRGRQAPQTETTTPEFRLNATIKDIMDSLIDPAADYIWDAVATTVTAKGREEKYPRTDEEWKELRRRAIHLLEGANLLLIPGFYDVAARDFGLSLGALALARLSREFA